MKIKIRKFEGGGTVPTSDDIIDPDEVLFGDDGNPITVDDDPNFEIDNDDPEGNDPDTGDNPSADHADDPTDDNPDDDPSDDSQEEPVNHADYVLRSLGFDTDQINVGDGVVKNVSELSEEEQLEFVTGRLEDVVSFYEGKLKDVTDNGAFSNNIEKLLIDTLRSNEHNLKDLVKVISENDPSTIAQTASNEELVKMHIKNLYPDFTEDDISEEMESMAGTSRFDKLASKLREKMSGQNMGEGELAKAISEYQTGQNQRVVDSFNEDKEGIVKYMEEVKEFGGIPLNDDVKNFVLAEIVPEDASGDSKFIESINDPERLFRLSFLDKFHEQVVENTAKHYFDLGKAEGNKISGKFKDTPDIISTGSRFKAKKSEAVKNKKVEEEF